MQYIYSSDTIPVIEKMASSINSKLQAGNKVLWLVSGGSGGKVSIEIAKRLQPENLANLYVTLSDERYGEVGHSNENWQILLNGGLKLPNAKVYRPLIGKDIQETTAEFSLWLENTITKVDYIVGLFGIGVDGHTAGIKPHSLAVASRSAAECYSGDDFKRITITPEFITKLNEAYVQVFGSEKHTVIKQLLNNEVPIDVQPAQILKKISNVTIYTDYKEE